MRILKSERDGIAVNLTIEREDGSVINHLIMDGSLESRAAYYGITEEEALEAVLIEWHILPPEEFLPEDDNAKVKAIHQKHRASVKWANNLKKSEVVANMRLPKARADLVRKEALVKVPSGPVYIDQLEREEAQQSYAKAHQRMLEERAADEFVQSLPRGKQRALRDTSPVSGPATVGLSIEIVP